MRNIPQKILIDQKDYNSIITTLLDFLRSENEILNWNEPSLQGAVGNFIEQIEEGSRNNSKNRKAKSDLAWEILTKEQEVSKTMFSKKLKPFVDEDFKRHSILRDIGNAHSLMSLGFHKEAVVLSGSVIEEILRLFLISKNMLSYSKTFSDYIKICEQHSLFKKGINRLTDFVREFRNLVHLSGEKNKKDTINKANAKSAIYAVFSFYHVL